MNAPSRATLDLVWARAGDDGDGWARCERCGCGLERNRGGYSIHHRRMKGMGGDRRPDTHLPANLLLLCGSGTTGCHAVVHHVQLEARDEGFLVSRYADPEQVAFLSSRLGWAFVDNEGQIRRADCIPPEEQAALS